ncbi:hypothetical protein CICLE_v10026422mg [Citrus x clementina]|uniref:SWIM-type domain-containing protein n=1 Tax=Citrus clementina TaxID=85681 RepID=V4SH17_CITCL|nr:hypothetical protein CICLE_v10026422mg [Citrus x clementina]
MFQRRYLAGWEWVYDKITPTARQQIIHNVFQSDGWNVDVPSNNAVSFVSRHGFVFEVNRELMTCSCRLWQLSGIPCEHACRCIHSWADKLDKYVHRLWSVDEYRSAYGPGMQMLREITHWEWQTKANVLPPMKNSTNSSGSNEANCHSKAEINPSIRTSVCMSPRASLNFDVLCFVTIFNVTFKTKYGSNVQFLLTFRDNLSYLHRLLAAYGDVFIPVKTIAICNSI